MSHRRVLLFLCVGILFNHTGQAQIPAEYDSLARLGKMYLQTGRFEAAATAYSNAFRSNGWKGYIDDRLKAACAWTYAGQPDSAFYQLDRIATKGKFEDIERIQSDTCFTTLQTDFRWTLLLETIKANQGLHPVAPLLRKIYEDDQKYRSQLGSHGIGSPVWKALSDTMQIKDSLNQLQVTAILDTAGWLGPDEVGSKGSTALFLVIQHAELPTQEKYLPMMQEAVKNGKADAAEVALLIDRVEMRNGRPQVYGSQIIPVDGMNTLYKILDEPNVNKRRAEMGMQPLEEYARYFGIEYTLPVK